MAYPLTRTCRMCLAVIGLIAALTITSARAWNSDQFPQPDPPKKKVVYEATLVPSGEPLTPDIVFKHRKKAATLEMTVKSSGKHGLILMLHACANSNVPENVMVRLDKKCQDALIEMGIKNPKADLIGKKIRANGKIESVAGIPTIDVYDPSRITIIEEKEKGGDPPKGG